MAEIYMLSSSPSLFILVISLLLLNINKFGRHYRRICMLIYGMVLALLTVQLLHAFSMDHLFTALFRPWQQAFWPVVVHVSVIFAICSFLLMRIFRQRQQSLASLSALGCFMGLVLVGGLSLPMQGVSTAILLILLGHYCNEVWLKGMGIVSALLFVSGYYYSLETSLMLKSGYLMGLGALLLVARIIMWRVFPVDTINTEEKV
jgi:uncharacterized membrane protein